MIDTKKIKRKELKHTSLKKKIKVRQQERNKG